MNDRIEFTHTATRAPTGSVGPSTRSARTRLNASGVATDKAVGTNACAPVEVYILPGAWGLPSVSPFCLKLLTWFRMVGIPYDLHVLKGPPTKPRTRKAPYIRRHDGSLLPDSSFIIETLKRERGITLDDRLTSTERAMAVLIQRTLEKSAYFVGVYNRWGPKWKAIGADMLPDMPRILFPIVTPFIRRHILKQPKAQGVSRNTREQIYAIGREDMKAVAELLGDRHFFFGEPSTIDATAYGFFANLIKEPFDDPLTDAVRRHANIVAFCDRMAERYW